MLVGEVELTLPDLPREQRQGEIRLNPGDFVYYPAQFSHTLTTVSAETANYLLLKWRNEARRDGPSLKFQKNNVFDFVEPSQAHTGFRPRRVFQRGTEYLSTLNCHVSTLTPGAGYDPHVDPYDVVIVLLQGEVETLGEQVSAHSVIFYPEGEPHGLYNPGDVTAVYLVFEFHGHARARSPMLKSIQKSQENRDTRMVQPGNQPGMSGANGTTSPIFVVGCGRSGTTLLQRIINAAPGASIFGEHNGFLQPLAEAYYRQRAKGCARPDADDAEFQHNVKRKLNDPKRWPGWLGSYRHEDLARRYAEFITGWFNPGWIDAPRWGFKEIRYGGSDRVVEMLLEIFPSSRFVFVARNPVDVIASQRLCGFGEFETLLGDWISSNEAYLKWAEDHPHRCRIVRYEDVVGSPRETIGGLYNWLELQDASLGIAVVDLPEGRYAVRAHDRLPREVMREERLCRIFTDAYKLAQRLGLTMPIVPEQREKVGFGLSKGGARIGPFSHGRVIRCDAAVLALWVLCDGRRNLQNIEAEMAPVADAHDVFLALDELLAQDVVTFKPEKPVPARDA